MDEQSGRRPRARPEIKEHASQGIDGVEVWSGKRFVYRYPPPKAEPNSN
jgi:hypothetical protein